MRKRHTPRLVPGIQLVAQQKWIADLNLGWESGDVHEGGALGGGCEELSRSPKGRSCFGQFLAGMIKGAAPQLAREEPSRSAIPIDGPKVT